MREPSTCLEALCLNSREAESLSVGVVGFEAIGGGSPLDSDSLRFSGDVSLVLRDCLLEDVACREQRHFDLVGDGVVLVLTAVFMLRIVFPSARQCPRKRSGVRP